MAKWQGTVVPNTGYVEKVYFNTNLSIDEVVSLLSKLETDEYNTAFILVSEDSLIAFMYVEGTYGILNTLTDEVYFLSNDVGNGFVGWNTAISYPLIINNNVVNSFQLEDENLVSGTQNHLLTSLFSTTPFTQSQPTIADKLQKLIDGKQYVVDKTNAKAGSDLKINSTWQSIGDAIERISGGGGQELADSIIDNTIESLTTNVETIGGYKFYRNTNLKTFNAPNLKTIGQYTFKDCTALESIDLPLVTSIGDYNFSGCTSLKNVNLPLVTSIGNYGFYKCTSLADLYLGYEGAVSLNNVNAFNDGATNTIVHVRADYADSYATATNWSSLIESGRITIVGDYSD